MSSDVHLMAGRYPAGGEDWEETWEGTWDGHNWPGGSTGGYYEEYAAGEMDFEVDLSSMVFSLDEHLEPQEIYKGSELDEKSLMITLEKEDVEEQSPAVWRSRPLRIHPEPATRAEKLRTPTGGGAIGGASQETDTGSAGATTPVGVGAAAGAPGLASPTASAVPAAAVEAASTPKESEDAAAAGGAVGEEQFSLSPAAQPAVEQSPATPSAAGGTSAQSPKIVISNTQLERLKQKMQEALKQRQKAPGNASAQEEERATTAEETDSAAAVPQPSPNSRGRVVHSNCPGLHGLRLFRTPDNGWWCSICEREHPKGAAFYGCRACDYDECERCALKPQNKPASGERAATPSPKKSRESPKASPRASPGTKAAGAAPQAAQRSSTAAAANNASTPEDSPSPQRRKERKRDREERKGTHRHKSSRKRTAESSPVRKAPASAPARQPEPADPSDDSNDDSNDDDDDDDDDRSSEQETWRPPAAASAAASKRSRRAAQADEPETRKRTRRRTTEAAEATKEAVRPPTKRRVAAAAREEEPSPPAGVSLTRASAGSSSRRDNSPESSTPPPQREVKSRPPARAIPERGVGASGGHGPGPGGPSRGRDGGNELLRRVLMATGDGGRRRPGGKGVSTSGVGGPPADPDAGKGVVPTLKPPRERPPGGLAGIRRALGDITSQKSRRA